MKLTTFSQTLKNTKDIVLYHQLQKSKNCFCSLKCSSAALVFPTISVYLRIFQNFKSFFSIIGEVVPPGFIWRHNLVVGEMEGQTTLMNWKQTWFPFSNTFGLILSVLSNYCRGQTTLTNWHPYLSRPAKDGTMGMVCTSKAGTSKITNISTLN